MHQPQILKRVNLPYLAAGCFLLLVLAFAYGPAIRLPLSLVDEVTHITNAHQLWHNLRTENLAKVIRHDVSSTLRTYNPVFWLHSAVLYAATNYSRPAYHAILLAELGFTAL